MHLESQPHEQQCLGLIVWYQLLTGLDLNTQEEPQNCGNDGHWELTSTGTNSNISCCLFLRLSMKMISLEQLEVHIHIHMLIESGHFQENYRKICVVLNWRVFPFETAFYLLLAISSSTNLPKTRRPECFTCVLAWFHITSKFLGEQWSNEIATLLALTSM